ncbi:hypothetical protein E2C01_042453 [Portunus trituberculatus]|uniref:Uncharacterized protein n=1 Tax=Portunus trituberculatus TaxID=210409 RepID=A0A5B7FQ99_PORTR|nr:hypothetical protein [Portunus trituberculatus]
MMSFTKELQPCHDVEVTRPLAERGLYGAASAHLSEDALRLPFGEDTAGQLSPVLGQGNACPPGCCVVRENVKTNILV